MCCRSRAQKIVQDLTDRGLRAEAAAVAFLVAGARWEDLPGWTQESVEKFWDSLTGDREHRIKACMKAMARKVSDPGAFCGGLASRVGYR